MKTHVMKYSQGEMLPLETKQSGGKLLPHSDLRGGVFLEEAPRGRQRKRDIVFTIIIIIIIRIIRIRIMTIIIITTTFGSGELYPAVVVLHAVSIRIKAEESPYSDWTWLQK